MNALLEAGSWVGFILVILGANLFVAFYGPFVRWWEKPFGRHLFAFMLVLTIILDHNLLLNLIGEYPGIWYAMFVQCWALAWVVWWRLKILLTIQIGRRHEHSKPIHPEEVPQDSHDSLGGNGHPDAPVVEGLGSVGVGDERLGERGGPLR